MNRMDDGRFGLRAFSAILAFSSVAAAAAASLFGCSKAWQKWQKKQNSKEKLKMIKEALEEGELRLAKYEERHDMLLKQICSNYLVNKNMEDALVSAGQSMTEALRFVVDLRKAQMEIITSFPG